MRKIQNNTIAIIAIMFLVFSISINYRITNPENKITGFSTSSQGLIIFCLNSQPNISINCTLTAYVDIPYNCDVEFNDSDGNNGSFYDNTSLFEINRTTGNITFTPISAGNHTINITYTDESNCSNENTSQIFNISILNNGSGITPPIDNGGGGGGGGNPCDNIECQDSTRVCWDASIARCSNACSNGVCGACTPNCPAFDPCYNVNCPDSTRTCESSIARCQNSCINGACQSCSPQCIQIIERIMEPSINDQSKTDKSNVHLNPIPCITTIGGLEENDIKINKNVELSQFNIPQGYVIALDPFSIDCNGESLDFTISIQNTYTDVQLLKCTQDNCYLNQIETSETIPCGDEIIHVIKRETEFISPELIPLESARVTLDINEARRLLSTKKNTVSFLGTSKDLKASIYFSTTPIKEAINNQLKIVSAPLNLHLDKSVQASIEVKMEYSIFDFVDEETLAIYSKKGDGWEYIGGNINKNDHTVVVTISNIKEYLDKDYTATFVIMGVMCTYCKEAVLEKVFEPTYKTSKAIIFIHGFASTPQAYKDIINEIKFTNYPAKVYTFAYPMSRSVLENSIELSNLLQKNSEEFEEISFVGHSLGGLITQQTLDYSYKENKKNPGTFDYINKVKKVILIASPTEGAKIVDVYKGFLDQLVNSKSNEGLFSLNQKIIQDLRQGINVPPLPHSEYYVIAGTKLYQFQDLFKVSDEIYGPSKKSDGLVPIESVQRIGENIINDPCSNYWELDLTHSSIVGDVISNKIILKILSTEMQKNNEDIALLGYNNFYKIPIINCKKNDRYVVIGKKINKEQAKDITGCACGNGVCGLGEDEINCPIDCFIQKSPKSNVPLIIIGFFGFTGFLLFMIIKKQKIVYIPLNEKTVDDLHMYIDITNKNNIIENVVVGFDFKQMHQDLANRIYSEILRLAPNKKIVVFHSQEITPNTYYSSLHSQMICASNKLTSITITQNNHSVDQKLIHAVKENRNSKIHSPYTQLFKIGSYSLKEGIEKGLIDKIGNIKDAYKASAQLSKKRMYKVIDIQSLIKKDKSRKKKELESKIVSLTNNKENIIALGKKMGLINKNEFEKKSIEILEGVSKKSIDLIKKKANSIISGKPRMIKNKKEYNSFDLLYRHAQNAIEKKEIHTAKQIYLQLYSEYNKLSLENKKNGHQKLENIYQKIKGQ